MDFRQSRMLVPWWAELSNLWSSKAEKCRKKVGNTFPNSCSLGVSTPYLGTFSDDRLLEWLSGRFTPDIWDIVRPTRVDDVDAAAAAAAAAAAPLLTAASFVLRPEPFNATSESSTRSEGKSNSCCLSAIAKKKNTSSKHGSLVRYWHCTNTDTSISIRAVIFFYLKTKIFTFFSI